MKSDGLAEGEDVLTDTGMTGARKTLARTLNYVLRLVCKAASNDPDVFRGGKREGTHHRVVGAELMRWIGPRARHDGCLCT